MIYTNRNIHNAINVLSEKVMELKRKYPDYPFVASLLKFSKSDISKWLEAEIEGKTTGEYNEIVMNNILEKLHGINEFIKSQNDDN